MLPIMKADGKITGNGESTSAEEQDAEDDEDGWKIGAGFSLWGGAGLNFNYAQENEVGYKKDIKSRLQGLANRDHEVPWFAALSFAAAMGFVSALVLQRLVTMRSTKAKVPDGESDASTSLVE